MSIPPLVCSTPPPLEQCEDDKDPEEFDLQYNLSQEDYEDHYDFGDFSTYNQFQATTSTQEKSHASTSASVIENVKESITSEESTRAHIDIALGTNSTCDTELKFEEDISIEDLNLKVDESSLDKPNDKDSSLEEIIGKSDEKISRYQETIYEPADKDSSLQETIFIPADKDSSLQETVVIPADKDNSLQETIYKPADKDSSLQETVYLPDDKDSRLQDAIGILNDNSLEQTVYKPDGKDSCLRDGVGIPINSSVEEISNSDNTNKQDEYITLTSEEVIVESANFENIEVPPICVDEKIEAEHNDLKFALSDNLLSQQPEDIKVCISDNIVSENASFIVSEHNTIRRMPEEHIDKINIDAPDDFGDFDDFQFASGNNKPTTIIDNCDNPWNSKESEDNDFGNFKANFQGSSTSLANLPELKSEYSTEDNQHSENQIDKHDSGDDFGDFNDFKSCATESEGNIVTEESIAIQQVPILNLESPDNESDIIESINKTISTIFGDELPETDCDNELEGKLDTMLGETWGHLLETDVRQPYIVNWNNSLGQKTLLKALCIDSRNILFGPKWSYNMPKYAVNLSNAPLQPQKPSTSGTAVHNVCLNPEKSGTKTTDTWRDPFASHGQEFTYAETLLLDLEHLMATLDQMAHNHSSLKISELLSQACNTDDGSENAAIETGPTDLDVFEASVSTKPDKIFSSTINVQPLRQINLPDTHIFTPTDSETPRSKTIHYDSSPSGVFPQTVLETNKNQSENLAPQSSGNADASNKGNDDEYWEFQDFKGNSRTLSPSASNQQPLEISESAQAKTSTNLRNTAVLQPIKVEPIMPTLNWPDPGEVKETFEDFSDFVANSSWSNEKQDTSPNLVPPQLENGKSATGSDKAASTKTEATTNVRVVTNTSDSFDDEFDTFQSALPPTTSLKPNFNHSGTKVPKKQTNVSLPIASQKFGEFSNTDSISFASASTSMSNANLVQKPLTFSSDNFDNITKVNHTVKSSMQPSSSQQHTSVLQPTPATSATSHNQQKSTQILQPLSLESYSQINWPNPGIDLQDLSRFNPVETLQSLKSDLSTNSTSKMGSPVHNHKSSVNHQPSDDDWGEFVSSKPKQQQVLPKKSPAFVDDDEWTDFVSSPSVKPQNGLNTISLNVHTNLNIQKSSNQSKLKSNQIKLDIPSLNYITPKSSTQKPYNDRHFQNL